MGSNGNGKRDYKMVWIRFPTHRATNIYSFYLSVVDGKRYTFDRTLKQVMHRAALLDRFLRCYYRTGDLENCFKTWLSKLRPVLTDEAVNCVLRLTEHGVDGDVLCLA